MVEGFLSIKTTEVEGGNVKIEVVLNKESAERLQKLFEVKMAESLNKAEANKLNSENMLLRAKTRKAAEEKRLAAVKDWVPKVDDVLWNK